MSVAMSECDGAPDLGNVYAENRGYLWGLCYRMTGSAADAEDLVQETFARALAQPPADVTQPWRPWLVRVAMNLSRDQLRRRKRSPYVGPWLPSPVETEELEERSYEPASTEARYELLESVSFAFLHALEALQPSQRAVLLLRDVFDYSGRETARALDLSEANVRQLLHRARRCMEAYDQARVRPTPELAERTRGLLERFLLHLAARDADGVEKLLAEDVVVTNDADGQFFAARMPVMGRRKVARFHVKIVRDGLPRVALRSVNGLPALVGEYDETRHGWAPRFVMLGWPDPDGRLWRIHTVIAPAKLSAIHPL